MTAATMELISDSTWKTEGCSGDGNPAGCGCSGAESCGCGGDSSCGSGCGCSGGGICGCKGGSASKPLTFAGDEQHGLIWDQGSIKAAVQDRLVSMLGGSLGSRGLRTGSALPAGVGRTILRVLKHGRPIRGVPGRRPSMRIGSQGDSGWAVLFFSSLDESELKSQNDEMSECCECDTPPGRGEITHLTASAVDTENTGDTRCPEGCWWNYEICPVDEGCDHTSLCCIEFLCHTLQQIQDTYRGKYPKRAPHHCWIEVLDCYGNEWRMELEPDKVGGIDIGHVKRNAYPLSLRNANGTVIRTGRTGYDDIESRGDFCIDCQPADEGCLEYEQNDCDYLEDTAAEYPWKDKPYEPVVGPNSNTFVAWIADQIGVSPSFDWPVDHGANYDPQTGRARPR